MNQHQRGFLERMARKYIWWQPARPPMEFPKRIMAQVMEWGTFEDIRALEETFARTSLVEVIQAAEPGWFSPRSWGFWHYRLGLAKCDEVPPLPARVLA